jgi:hypothetical protein
MLSSRFASVISQLITPTIDCFLTRQKAAMATTNFKTSGNGADDDDDEDERKPPAKEIVISQSHPSSPSKDNNVQNPDTSQDSDLNFAVPISTEASVASTASSVSAVWCSPVARAQPRRTTSPRNVETPKLKGKRGLRRDHVPSLTASTPGSPFYRVENHIQPIKPDEESLAITARRLQRHVVLWLATVLVATAVFIYQVLPTAALATLLFILASTGMMTQTLLTAARRWYFETVTSGPGIGQWLLPRSLFETLTQTSLHEYLTAPSVSAENFHLLLYFLPISAEQLDESIRRLAPQHQERLHRRGLGHIVLGEGLMRVLLGEPQYRELQRRHFILPGLGTGGTNDSQRTGTTIEVESNHPLSRHQRLLLASADEEEENDGEDFDEGMENSANGLPLVTARRLIDAASSDNDDNAVNSDSDNNNGVPFEQEMRVLSDALWISAYSTVWTPFRDYMSTAFVRPAVGTVGRWGTRLGILFSITSVGGLGWFWWISLGDGTASLLPSVMSMFSGALLESPTNTRRRTVSSATSVHGIMWNPIMAGGLSMGVTLYAYNQFRRGVREQARTNGDKTKKGDKRAEK